MAYAFIAHTSITWRAVYWFCFAVELFAFVMVVLFYKPPTFKTKHAHEGVSKGDLAKHQDYLGLFLFAAGLTLLLLGISWVSTFPPCLATKCRTVLLMLMCFLGWRNSSLEECIYDYTYRDRLFFVGLPRCLVEIQ